MRRTITLKVTVNNSHEYAQLITRLHNIPAISEIMYSTRKRNDPTDPTDEVEMLTGVKWNNSTRNTLGKLASRNP